MNPLSTASAVPQWTDYSIAFVTRDLLTTSEGRKRYSDFLKNQPNIPAFYKLYGLEATPVVDKRLIKKQINEIKLEIHPDKSGDDSELFCLVMSTVNEYFKELGFSSAVNSAQPRISSADLQGFIKEGK